MAATNAAPKQPNLEPADFKPRDTIATDLYLVGGGCSSTYTAIRLQDHGKNVVMIEKRDDLEDHALTYTDPDTGTALDIGVIVFGQLEEVKNYFARSDISLKTVATSLGPPEYVDFKTGQIVGFKPPDKAAVGAAFQRYMAELLKYPKLQEGFGLAYPVRKGLTTPFCR